MVFMWLALISSSFISIVVSIYNLVASIVLITLLSKLIILCCYSEDVESLEIRLSCSIIFVEYLF